MTNHSSNTAAEKPALKPANENPWYCLATLYGEQPQNGFDAELASKNRDGWNNWVVAIAPDGNRLKDKNDHILINQQLQMNQIIKKFESRTNGRMMPDTLRTEIISLSNLNFDNAVNFERFVFPLPVTFNNSIFQADTTFLFAHLLKDAIFRIVYLKS